jgi:hypothetical protein
VGGGGGGGGQGRGQISRTMFYSQRHKVSDICLFIVAHHAAVVGGWVSGEGQTRGQGGKQGGKGEGLSVPCIKGSCARSSNHDHSYKCLGFCITCSLRSAAAQHTHADTAAGHNSGAASSAASRGGHREGVGRAHQAVEFDICVDGDRHLVQKLQSITFVITRARHTGAGRGTRAGGAGGRTLNHHRSSAHCSRQGVEARLRSPEGSRS